MSRRGVSSSPPRRPVDAMHYAIDTTMSSNLEIRGTTTVRLLALTAGVRVVPVQILPKMRLRRVTFAAGSADAVEVGLVQEEVELGRFARLFREEVADADAAVVLPGPMKAGQPCVLVLEYDGRDVLHGVGPESYSVRARESWYPNLGTFADTAAYELTFRYPRRNNLIATGKLVSERQEGDVNVAQWKSELPMRIAGFNYGKFDKTSRSDEQSGVAVDVYTSRDFKKFASDAMADALNAARVGRVFYGVAPYTPFSVTQQVEWSLASRGLPSSIFRLSRSPARRRE
jgi:hypothetical protein